MDAQESEIGRRAAEAQERLKHVAATASSTDGAVALTVNTAGALQKLYFGASADEMPRAAAAATARRAQVRAAERLSDIMAPVIGEHSGR
ncbi:YbaB/EbfC DNA-binding family protein [Amycolatopsis sulphurea]|uniref:YbaB/EbfC DNA-binding family protein n=1 Tax=Amycolatopsis sulphurea TaxID=76022 RepID=A0A2A9FGW9_9PSEU|nr:YbaB/EbfC family nucleoid-associated protein [Amycolatopsis sulphurea]PFG50388.1 YbaB/EbfC DNA-binding family protein [Amycolatopsis sulphurea]